MGDESGISMMGIVHCGCCGSIATGLSSRFFLGNTLNLVREWHRNFIGNLDCRGSDLWECWRWRRKRGYPVRCDGVCLLRRRP